MMQKRAATRSILLVAILILMVFAAAGCATDVPQDTIKDVPKATVEVEWEKDLTLFADLSVRSIQQTSDGGYFIVGTTNCGYGMGPGIHISTCDIVLIKTDVIGNVEWEKNKSSQWYYLDSAFQTSDGGYMFSFSDKLIKTNATGDEEWQKGLPRVSGIDSIVRQTSDGGYIILGTEVFWGNHGGFDIWLAKTDASGNVEWEKTLGNGVGAGIQQTSDNGFIIHTGRGWLLKTDWTGKQQYDEILGHGQFDQIYGHGQLVGVIEATDGGFIVLSRDDDGTWLTRLGTEWHPFGQRWDNNYARQYQPVSIQRTPYGGCIVIEAGALMKVDCGGHVEWEAPLGSFGGISPMAQTSDGGYIAVIQSRDNPAWDPVGESSVRLMKLNVTPP